jgi:D-glycero-D-manno-heptose 1,7-bisphosphate phosphatase
MMKTTRAVFLDRDGVITEDPPHYAHRVDQVRVISGSGDAIRMLNEAGYLVIVVSNQSGIARGFYKKHDFDLFNKEMKRQLSIDNAHIDAIYHCPHHPEAAVEKYRKACTCRKPKPGMLIRAAKRFNIDMSSSFLVGDKWTDICAGNAVRCRSILVRTGHGAQEASDVRGLAVFIAKDLSEAVKNFIILNTRSDYNIPQDMP